MQDRINIGVIGCGGMCRTHMRNLSKIPEAYLKGYADARPEAAQAFLSEYGGEYATQDPRKIFDDKDIQLVLICTHHDAHGPLAIEAAKAGKHIFVEKPLTLTIEGCQQVEAAVEAFKVKLMMGFQARFSPFTSKLKELVPKPLVTVGQLVDPRWGDESWANDPIKGGGNVLSQGCHLFDLVYWLNESEPVSIYAEGGNFHHPKLNIIDSVVTTIRFANSSVASVTIGDFGASPYTGKAFYELFDGKRSATLYRYYSEPAIKAWGADITVTDFGINDLPEDQRQSQTAHGYVAEMQALIDWVLKNIDPIQAAKAKDGTRATALGIKAIESIKTGTPQAIKD